MKLWRNGEGCEFPACSNNVEICGVIEGCYITPAGMRNLGYELVENEEPEGSPIEPERLREVQRKAWAEGWLSGKAEAKRDWKNALVNPYDPPPAAVSEEFEAVCVENREASERWPHLTPVLIHVGLIPGEIYSVRKVKR